jgi:hypothetical protein
VRPRLLGDSLSIALDRVGEWDVVHLDDRGRPPDEGVAAAIVSEGLAGRVRSEVVIELPDDSVPGRDGYVQIHGRRQRISLTTISAIVEILRAAALEARDGDDPED